MIGWRKVRKKPVVVEAWGPWDGTRESTESLRGMGDVGGSYSLGLYERDGRLTIGVGTLEGVMEASPGDYIIRGVKGELYPCKPDVFAETYESAEVSEIWKAGGGRGTVAT